MKTYLPVLACLMALACVACKKDSKNDTPVANADTFVSFSIGDNHYRSDSKSISLEIDSAANVFETNKYDYTYTLTATSTDTAHPYALQITTFFEESKVLPGTYTDTTNEVDGFQYLPVAKNTDDLYASSRQSLSVTTVTKIDSLHFEGTFQGRVTATTGAVDAPGMNITNGQFKLSYSALNVIRKAK